VAERDDNPLIHLHAPVLPRAELLDHRLHRRATARHLRVHQHVGQHVEHHVQVVDDRRGALVRGDEPRRNRRRQRQFGGRGVRRVGERQLGAQPALDNRQGPIAFRTGRKVFEGREHGQPAHRAAHNAPVRVG
jgi:hypothetical protein